MIVINLGSWVLPPPRAQNAIEEGYDARASAIAMLLFLKLRGVGGYIDVCFRY